MTGEKNIWITFGFVLSVSLIASAVSVMFASYCSSQRQFQVLNGILSEAVRMEPETKYIISAALKNYTGGGLEAEAEEDILSAWGYRRTDFSGSLYRQNILSAVAGAAAGTLLFVSACLCRNKAEAARIQALAEYLEQVNTGRAVILSTCGEDDFSKLEDEVYKTVTALYHTRDSAVQAKQAFAENLSNIAHQIKTPITAISLSLQLMKEDSAGNHLKQAERQLLRLTHLEEALLVLARIDAGTLLLQKDEVDVFTLLVLAADNLGELFVSFAASVDIPEAGEVTVSADLDWTMEAVMNVMKNCMEHNRGGTVHCSYGQNPLYTELLIWDDGEGFAKEDIPHLFERFYRGKNSGEGGIGIGLALSREIVERQNGTISAKNKPGGGALFEIRFYSH